MSVGSDELLARLPRWIMVGGKGGVGKTTAAAALAIESARREATLLFSTDPARALGDALGASLGGAPQAITGVAGLSAFQLDPTTARSTFLEKWRDVLTTIVDRGTYLEREDVAGLVESTLPGIDETMALLTFIDLERDQRWKRIVVDTAPTGHTLRLLDLPRAFEAMVALLEAMQDKHRFMVRALTHRYRADEADRFLREMRSQIAAVRDTLGDSARAAMLLVARAEALVLEETRRYAAVLPSLGVSLGAMVLNAVPDDRATVTAARVALRALAPGAPLFEVPRLAEPPLGRRGLTEWADALHESTRTDVAAPPLAAPPTPNDNPASETGATFPLAPVTLVVGKGGVGKTTVACALGVSAGREMCPLLIVSTDPAPSVADALEQPVGDEIVAVAGVEGVFAQQLDAAAAFERFRLAYTSRVDEMFDTIMGSTMDAAADRRIVRDLLALAPPGIDELYALTSIGETVSEQRFTTIVIDPAPTGHLLRLLEMPAIALEWTHRLMRLMLKYKNVTGLGETAKELLAFAQRTRALDELLRDPVRAAATLVVLDEPLVREESLRLAGALSSHGVTLRALVWNRASSVPTPLPVAVDVAQFETPERVPAPRGAVALRAWRAAWRAIMPTGFSPSR